MKRGFTLIELSIVLVIIGLIVGGVLAGQSLINAAALRAQITQIERYNTAANTFYEKFGALPGDIPAALVTQFGFTANPVRAGTLGFGDGNGELDGGHGAGAYSWSQSGETLYFWEDLSANSSLIDGTFDQTIGSVNCATVACVSDYIPPAKIGGGNFIYVYSGYADECCVYTGTGPNFFGLSVVNAFNDSNVIGPPAPAPGLTVEQAYAIDGKIDDGLPQSGRVLAQYLGAPRDGAQSWSTNAAMPSSTTCFDTTSGNYSINENSGTGVNCALSFRFQSGD
jgi:prepilin-type N-terminal cleavage/methylation domain-containing protein